MGNLQSSESSQPLSSIPMDDLTETEKKKILKDHDFSYILNYIATRYILTLNFESLKNLQDPKYCDEMIILTSDILKKYFNEREIEFLQQKLEKGAEINKMSREKVIYFNKDELAGNDINSGVKKNRMCIGIAKFYIKIAHLFSAIVMTVNPVYVYKENNETVKKSLLEKKDIPKGVEPIIEKMGICNARFQLLNIGNNYLNSFNTIGQSNNPENIEGSIEENMDDVNSKDNKKLKSKYCNFNKKINNSMKENLADEPGIPELINLYYDKYDYEKGQYTGMTENTKKKFIDDLFLFYKHFTGIEDVIKKQNSDINDKKLNDMILNEFNSQGIQKFSDIKLKDYSSTFQNICSSQDSNGKIMKEKMSPQEITRQQELLKKYAENLKNMLKNINGEQEKLLNILNEIFSYIVDGNKKKIVINPTLNNDMLDKLVTKTREIIIGLYLQCETDYIDGLKLYQAVIENQVINTELTKLKNLDDDKKELLYNKKEQPTNSSSQSQIVEPIYYKEPSASSSSSAPSSSSASSSSSAPSSSSASSSSSAPSSSSATSSSSAPSSSSEPSSSMSESSNEDNNLTSTSDSIEEKNTDINNKLLYKEYN
jgi:hypothetical protein